MAVVRIHRYSVDPAEVDELLTRRTALIAAIRAEHPGLAEARLIRLEDGTFIDAWRWESEEQMQGGAGRGAQHSRGRRRDVPRPGAHRRGRRGSR
jgi:hypothetical protein